MTAAPTHYRLLNVPPAAGDEEIRKAFWRLSREYHPDRAANQLDVNNRAALIRAINEAYSVLKTTHTRAAYDKLLALRYAPCGRCKGAGQRWGVGGDSYVLCGECQGAGWWEKAH
jgi:curved DNA-binding protein CbpA